MRGTQVLLEAARELGVQALPPRLHRRGLRLARARPASSPRRRRSTPTSPYSASKAASDLLALAYAHTFGLPVVVTRCSNNYGPYQFPEKLIPLMIANALARPAAAGLRRRHERARLDPRRGPRARAARRARAGEARGRSTTSARPRERHNIDIVKRVLAARSASPSRSSTYVKDRPGHDRRYAIDCAQGAARARLGAAPRASRTALAATVRWYVEHRAWWERILSGEYLKYYEKQYGARPSEGRDHRRERAARRRGGGPARRARTRCWRSGAAPVPPAAGALRAGPTPTSATAARSRRRSARSGAQAVLHAGAATDVDACEREPEPRGG